MIVIQKTKCVHSFAISELKTMISNKISNNN